MGRAIDMEKDIDMLKIKVEKLENIVRGMSHTMSKTEHIDIIEETKNEEEIEDGKKETNNEGNGKSSSKSNKRKTDTTTKTSKS